MQKTGLRLSFILLTLCFLCGCVNAAITGAQTIYNRHNIQANLNDQFISMKAQQAIYLRNAQFKDTNVSVATFHGVVLLAGQAPKPSQKIEIEQLVKKIDGIKELHNQITTSPPSSAIIQASDTWITAKIKAKLIAMNDIDPNLIKVVTENGTVYLMGILPPEQADIAVDLARTTEGVQNVVKVFQYLRISKT